MARSTVVETAGFLRTRRWNLVRGTFTTVGLDGSVTTLLVIGIVQYVDTIRRSAALWIRARARVGIAVVLGIPSWNLNRTWLDMNWSWNVNPWSILIGFLLKQTLRFYNDDKFDLVQHLKLWKKWFVTEVAYGLSYSSFSFFVSKRDLPVCE